MDSNTRLVRVESACVVDDLRSDESDDRLTEIPCDLCFSEMLVDVLPEVRELVLDADGRFRTSEAREFNEAPPFRKVDDIRVVLGILLFAVPEDDGFRVLVLEVIGVLEFDLDLVLHLERVVVSLRENGGCRYDDG